MARAKRNVDLEILMSVFHNGLKKEIWAEMTVAEFPNLAAMMDWALKL